MGLRTGVAFSGLLASMLATSAFAAEIGFTPNSPPGSVSFTAGGLTGTIDPFTGILDANDTICLDGACDLASQDWMVFTVTVTGGSLSGAGVGALMATSEGVGYFLQGGPPQNGTGGTDTYVGDQSIPTIPIFTFTGSGGSIGLTGTSLPLFVTYANGTLPTPAGAFGEGATAFMISDYSSASTITKIVNVAQPIDIVPEPSTALLLSAGLLLLGALSRRRRA